MIDMLFFGSILFFLLLLLFFGFSLFYIARIHLSDSWFVRIFFYLGAGLGVLVFLIVFFDVVGIPLNYRIFFVVSLLCPFHYFLRKFNRETLAKYSATYSLSSFFSGEYFFYGIVLFATLVLFATFLSGTFAYSYLEDDDPWGHAIAVKYIAEEKTYYQKEPGFISHYLEPYPPTYDAILSLVYQINGSLLLTLKIFNVLLIALGILFFFIFVLELFDIKIATVATLTLVALPSWISHFIWSHTLALVLFFPALTVAVRAVHRFPDTKWVVPAAVLIAAELVTHPFVAVLFGVFYFVFVLWYFFWLEKKNSTNIFSWNPFAQSFLIGFLGVLFSFFYWGQQLFRHGLNAVLYSHTGGFGGVATVSLRDVGQTAADLYINPAYSLSDFLIAPIFTKIDQPTGFGVVVFLLAVFAIIFILWNYKEYLAKEKMHFIVFAWFVLTFLGLLGGHLPFSILTHRFWAYVSIPLAILAGIFIVWLLEKLGDKKILFFSISAFLFFAIFGVPFTTEISLEMNPTYNATEILSDIGEQPILGTITAINILSSWQPKKIVETIQWPPGVGWSSVQELEGYVWMHQKIAGKKVLSLCKEERYLFGFDLETEFPSKEMDAFRKDLANASIEDIRARATAFDSSYDYLSLEYSCVKKGYLTEAQLNALANQLSQYFSIVFMNDEIVVYQIE